VLIDVRFGSSTASRFGLWRGSYAPTPDTKADGRRGDPEPKTDTPIDFWRDIVRPIAASQSEGAMSKSKLATALAALALLCSVTLAEAQQSGTAAEAKAMLDRAVIALKTNETTAISEFSDKNNKQFHDRDLYVFCYDVSDGKITAHPNPALMGRDVRNLKLKDDPFGQKLLDAAQRVPEGGVATVEYEFPKPGTTEPVPKESFVVRVGDQGCGVGYYK
jgi:hypothetical protein